MRPCCFIPIVSVRPILEMLNFAVGPSPNHHSLDIRLIFQGLHHHQHLLEYPIFYKNAKKDKLTELNLPFFNNKSLKNNCYGELKISWIMSTK